MKIAFIGLGNMGGGMAANLVRAGHQVRAFDLSERVLTEVPDTADPRRCAAAAELTAEEKAWLESASVEFGFSTGDTASRVMRLLVRALIRHRDLLPVQVPFDATSQPWLSELEAEPRHLAERLRPWADALPEGTVRELIGLLEDSLRGRR